MAVHIKADDSIRLKMLEALLKKGSVIPNLRQIKRYSAFHKATIKSSIDFLLKEGVLQGFGPKIDFNKFGFKLEVIELLHIDFAEKEIFKQYLNAVEKDPNIYMVSAVIGGGTWNLLLRHFYRDVESFHSSTQKNYYEKIKGIHKLIKDRQIIYATSPFYKIASRTSCIIEILKREKGID
jgi:DNA-binding Lrp family transcriptional regulator